MNLSPSNQRNKDVNLFGFLVSRLLYQGPHGPRETPHDEVTLAQREVAKKVKKYGRMLKGFVDVYNANFGEEPEDDDDIKEGAHYETLILDLRDLDNTKKQILAIIKKLKGDEEPPKDLKGNEQYEYLRDLLESISDVKKLPQEGREVVRRARRGRLARRHKLLIEAGERKEAWKKKDAYGELSDIFDTLASSDKHKNVWQSPEGLTTVNQREGKQLFFAMMAEKTDNFKNTFVLGPETVFGKDPAENIKRFPYIYNEFLKYEGAAHKELVSLERIATAESVAAESKRTIDGMRTAKAIITANTDAGIRPSQLSDIPTIPSTAAWKKRWHTLRRMVHQLEERAAKETDLAHPRGWQESANELRVHRDHAEAYLKLSKLKDRERNVQKLFTRAELTKPKRRKMLMEFVMMKYMKAIDMVDSPFSNANWQQTLHPTVRRMLIASIYDSGVATFEKDKHGVVSYDDNIKGQQVWMLSSLALSKYFNFEEVGADMDPTHSDMLKAAYLGSKITILLKQTEETRDMLEDWIGLLEEVGEDGLTPSIRVSLMGKYPPKYAKRYAQYSKADAESALRVLNGDRKRLQDFLDETETAIKDPYSKESQEFIEKMKNDEYRKELGDDVERLGRMGIIDGATLQAYEKQMYNLQINFKTAELQDKNSLMFFEGLGMHIEGIEPAYLIEIAKNPKLKIEYWEALLVGSKAQFNSLIKLFRTILPPDIAGGKEDFIQGLISLRNKYKGKKTLTYVLNNPEEGSEDGVIINVMRMLKIHLGHRAEIDAMSDLKMAEIQAQLKGVHLGDKVSRYVGGVWNMLTGPGQSMANRAAGLVLMYGFYKATRKAMKGEGPSGKMLRALFVAGAVEIAAKEITGRGVLDRLGLDSIRGAMEGTYEGVLLQDGEQHMEEDLSDKKITDQAHSAALIELRDVPFHQIVKWYESSKPNGMPRTGVKTDYFQDMNISLSNIKPKVTWTKKNKEAEARRVVWETVRHFFGYVGEKDNKRNASHGKEALKARWIDVFDHPERKSKHTHYTHREWIKAGNVKKNDITWHTVMSCEISPQEVELSKDKTPVSKLTAKGKDVLTKVSDWSRKYVYNPGAGHVEDVLDSMGDLSQKAKNLAEELYLKTSRQVYFGKEKMILWYGRHQYEIKRTAKNHWDLFVTGVALPFKVILAVDQAAIPWTLSKLEQLEQSLTKDEHSTTGRELDWRHVVSNPLELGSPFTQLNPEYSKFGEYQRPFLNAISDPDPDNEIVPGVPDRITRPRADWYYEDEGQHVGYFITEISDKEADIKPGDPVFQSEPENRTSKMWIKSHEKAIAKFRIKAVDMDLDKIKKYMYPVHHITKTTGGFGRRKLYIFWRMPLPDSVELYLKETGKWADYEDSNKHKDRDHFETDPSQTEWENIKRAFALDMDVARTLGGGIGGYAAQLPRFVMWNMQLAGRIINAIGADFFEGGDEFREAVEAITNRPPATKQFMDELFTSAKSEHKASSEFYSDSENAYLYRFAREYALRNDKPLFLGIMQNRPDYAGTAYLRQMDPQVYDKMRAFYGGWSRLRENHQGEQDHPGLIMGELDGL